MTIGNLNVRPITPEEAASTIASQGYDWVMIDESRQISWNCKTGQLVYPYFPLDAKSAWRLLTPNPTP